MAYQGLELSGEGRLLRAPRWWTCTSIGFFLFSVSACGMFEPIVEPELADLQLSIDTLKTSLRDTQRTMMELRDEIDTERQELADTQIARAQLEGRLRETERRFLDARHVIELQREELADTRTERERVAKAEVALQNQVKQLQKQVAKMRRRTAAGGTPAAMASPGEPAGLVAATIEQSVVATMVDESTGAIVKPAIHVPDGLGVTEIPVSSSMGRPRRIFINPGDTLSGIARRYHVSVRHLMALNALLNDHIEVGQVLWLTELDAYEH
jgi:uncharacterized protein YhaN